MDNNNDNGKIFPKTTNPLGGIMGMGEKFSPEEARRYWADILGSRGPFTPF